MREPEQPVSVVDRLEVGARREPERTALLWRDQAWTYSWLLREVRRLSNAWAGQGPRGHIACFLDKCPELVVAFAAAGAAGHTYVPSNPNAGAEPLKSQFLEAPPSWVVVREKHLERVSGLAEETGIRPRFVVVDGPDRTDSRYLNWTALLAGASTGSAGTRVPAGAVAYLNMTSGTSGKPKLALATHANIYWNVVSACARLGLTRDDVFLCGFPAFLHPHETIARGLLLGGAVLLEDEAGTEPGLDGFWQALRTGRATTVMANPAVYRLLAGSVLAGSGELASIRIFESGGSPVSADLAGLYRERFAAPLIPVWGSTETTGAALAAVPLPPNPGDGLLGTPCPSYRVKVIADDGASTPPGCAGELLVSGPAVVSGYLGGAENHRFQDGWFHTGDLVTEREGSLYFTGRADFVFKSAGLKVHPEEVEAVLLRHRAIWDAAVVAVPDPIRGSEVKALLVLREGASLSRAELVAHCLPHLEPHRIPRQVSFVGKLPRAESGKLLRSRLDPSA
jgi:long-chain acyl-CoA synthetase